MLRTIVLLIIGVLFTLYSTVSAQSSFLHAGESAGAFGVSVTGYEGPDYYASSISLARGGQFDVAMLYGSRSDRQEFGGSIDLLLRKTPPDSLGPVMSILIGFTQSSADEIGDHENKLLFGTRLALNVPFSSSLICQPTVRLRFEAAMASDGEGGSQLEFLWPMRLELARRLQIIGTGGWMAAGDDNGPTLRLTLVYKTVLPGGE